MGDLSYYESRPGKVTCNAEMVFNFVTDIRNFDQFIPEGKITNWQAEKESCSFDVSGIGTVSFRLTEKQKSKVVYMGDALKKNDFSLELGISDDGLNSAGVKLSLSADLNPMLKMMAAKPISQLLEILMIEIEKFEGWKEINE